MLPRSATSGRWVGLAQKACFSFPKKLTFCMLCLSPKMGILGHSSDLNLLNPLSLLPLYPQQPFWLEGRERALLLQAGSHQLISALPVRVIKYLEDGHFTASLDPMLRHPLLFV